MNDSGTRAISAELLRATDGEIADAVGHADPMVLRGLLHQLTDDPEIRAIETVSIRRGVFEYSAPATDDDVALLQRKTVDLLIALRDSGRDTVELRPEARLRESMSLTVGNDIPDDELGLWEADLGIDPWARSLAWTAQPTPEQLEGFSVTVIGAGMGGLNAAIQLKRAGIPFTVLEKNGGVGGTWHENRYPGARVDVPSRAYTHIFGIDYPYPYTYCPWPENQRYFDWVADHFGIREDIQFHTEVCSMVWDEAAAVWEITAVGPEGPSVLRSNAVITAVGFLNRPNVPDLEGAEEFAGESWHSARWPDDVDLTGTRVAVIGSGCTGYQIVPELALEVGHLTLFQRTPQWMVETPGYTAPLAPQVAWLDRNLPLHTNFMRLRVAYRHALALDYVDVDPDYDDDPTAVSAENAAVRDAWLGFLERKLPDPELRAKMVPPHPPFSARPVITDPDHSVLDAIQQPHVTLVTEGIGRLNAGGIEDGAGTQHDVDVIVYATGFRASDYLWPMEVRGRNGVTLEELWAKDGPRAYIGTMMPGFPNLWSIYGPNTNGCFLVATFHELTARYAMQCMERLILEGKRTAEVTEDAYWRYNAELDEHQRHRVYTDPRTKSYYLSERYGRSVTNCGLTAGEMWQHIREPDFDDVQVR
jgi:4-hydroxyacetophenone monooxygenase